MIRDAKFADIPRIVELMIESHQRSIYAETATFDKDEAKQMLARALQRHGHTNNGGSLVLVSEKGGVVEGFIIGVLDSVYPCLKELRVTDLLFIQSERAEPKDAIGMLKRLDAWASENPKVIEVFLGVTSAIGDYQRTSKLYERLGYSQCGALFQKRIAR